MKRLNAITGLVLVAILAGEAQGYDYVFPCESEDGYEYAVFVGTSSDGATLSHEYHRRQVGSGTTWGHGERQGTYIMGHWVRSWGDILTDFPNTSVGDSWEPMPTHVLDDWNTLDCEGDLFDNFDDLANGGPGNEADVVEHWDGGDLPPEHYYDGTTPDASGNGIPDSVMIEHGLDPESSDLPEFGENDWLRTTPYDGEYPPAMGEVEWVRNEQGVYEKTYPNGAWEVMELEAFVGPSGMSETMRVMQWIDGEGEAGDMVWERRQPASGEILEEGQGWPTGYMGGYEPGDAWVDLDTRWSWAGEEGEYQASGDADEPSSAPPSGGWAGGTPSEEGDREGSLDGETPVEWGEGEVADAVEQLRFSNAEGFDDLWAELADIQMETRRVRDGTGDIVDAIERQTGSMVGGGGFDPYGEPGDPFEFDPDGEGWGLEPDGELDLPVAEDEGEGEEPGLMDEDYEHLPDPSDYEPLEPFTIELDMLGDSETIEVDLLSGGVLEPLEPHRPVIRAVILFGFVVHLIGRFYERVIQS